MANEHFNLRRNVAASVLSFIANIVLVFLSYKLVILQGGIGALGLWSSLMAWVFLVRLGDVGMSNAVVRYAGACDAGEEPLRVRRYVDSGLAMNGFLFLGLSLVGWAVMRANLEHIFPDDLMARETSMGLLPVLFGAFFLQNVSGTVLGALRSIHLGYVSAKLAVSGTMVQLVIVVLLVPKIGLAGLAWGQLVQYLVVLLSGWVMFVLGLERISGRREGILPRNLSVQVVREMFGFSARTQVANIASGLLEPISKILIGRFAGLDVLGLFEMAFKMVALPRHAVVSGVQAAIPAMTRLVVTDLTAARALYRRSFKITGLSSAIVLTLIALASPLASILLLGYFEPMVFLFTLLLSCGFLGNALGASAYTLGVAFGRIRGNIESAILAGVLGSLLVVLGGRYGPSWSMVAGVAVALAVGGWWVRWRNERLLYSTSTVPSH